MNDLQKELQDLKAKIAELEARVVAEPIAKWQPKGGDWWIGDGGIVYKSIIGFSQISKIFATGRQTKEQAQRAAVEMRRFNRLLALRDELCGDEVVDWSNNNDPKYRVYFSYADKMWHVSLDTDTFCENITPHFTTKELAQRACYMLNSGEVEL